MESSNDEFGVLEDDRRIDTGRFQERYLLHEFSVCWQQSPASAATTQQRHPNSSRLVRLENSGQVRSGSLACCREFECGCACGLTSLLVSQVVPGKPFVSRQQVSLAITLTRVEIETEWKRMRSWRADSFSKRAPTMPPWKSLVQGGLSLRAIAGTECAILPIPEFSTTEGAASEISAAQEGAPQRAGPCWHEWPAAGSDKNGG